MAENKFLTLSGLTRYDSNLKTYIGKLLEAANGDITKVERLINTLIGDDSGKSARTIANEELAKQLIPDGAKEALDTLQEIAAWIQNHPDDVATMNKAIEDNKEAIENEADRAGEAEKALAERLDTLEGTGAGSVAKALADAKEYADTKKAEAISTVQGTSDDTKDSATVAGAKKYADNAVGELSGTAVSSSNGTDITVTLGGTVGAPTVTVTHNFVAVTDAEIDALFAAPEEQA